MDQTTATNSASPRDTNSSPVASSPAPATQAPTAPPPITKPADKLKFLKSKPTLIVILLAVVGIAGGILIGQLNRNPPEPATPTPTPTTAPLPTPIQPEIPLATGSAYLELNQAVQDTKTAINSYNTNDPGLSPPVLDLPLGFK